jgi:hypothetical protein
MMLIDFNRIKVKHSNDNLEFTLRVDISCQDEDGQKNLEDEKMFEG